MVVVIGDIVDAVAVIIVVGVAIVVVISFDVVVFIVVASTSCWQP